MYISPNVAINGRLCCYDLPTSKSELPPLLIGLHGGSGNGLDFRVGTALASILGESVVMAYPTATLNSLGFTGWNAGGEFNPNVDDVSYIISLRQYFIDKGLVDPNRVYLLGHSEGAIMGYRLICEHPELFAGLYSMSGNILVNNPDTFAGKLRETHGTSDQNIPFNGGIGTDSFYKIDWPTVADTVNSFTNVQNAGLGNLNPLVGYGHSVAEITAGLISQGNTLQLDVQKLIFG